MHFLLLCVTVYMTNIRFQQILYLNKQKNIYFMVHKILRIQNKLLKLQCSVFWDKILLSILQYYALILLHCVVLPVLSTPSITINAPRFNTILKYYLLYLIRDDK